MRSPDILIFMRIANDIATCMYYTGLDPFTRQEVYVARHLRDCKLQRALLQFFKPENYFEVRKALLAAGRHDLIGPGCDALISSQPPQAAVQARMAKARSELTEWNPPQATRLQPVVRRGGNPACGVAPKGLQPIRIAFRSMLA